MVQARGQQRASPVPRPEGAPFDLAALRAEVASIRHPGAAPDPVVATPSASSAAIAVRRRLRRARWLTIGWSTPLVALGLAGGGGPAAAAIIVAGGGAALALGRLGAFRGDISSLRRALSDAQRNWAAEWACWQERATPVRFDAAVAAFRSRCTSWEQLTQRYPTADLRAHLSRLEIAGAGIPGIGRGRTRKLEARGIKSAADFDRAVLAGVQELNAQLQANLLAWQAGHQRLFTEARNELAQLETDLRADVAHIRTEAAAVTAARRNPSSLITARTAVLQATADLAAVGR